MEKIVINVYDDNGNVVKTSEAQKVKFKFGQIRAIMELLNIEDVPDTVTLMRVIYNAWDQLIRVLDECFIDMTYEDWENVPVDELIPAVFEIVRYSFSEMMNIPTEKNQIAGQMIPRYIKCYLVLIITYVKNFPRLHRMKQIIQVFTMLLNYTVKCGNYR